MMHKQKNSIFQNILYLFSSSVLANVLNAVTLIVLAHYFSATNYGIFSVALAYAMVLNYFTDLGVSNTFIREGSKKEKRQAHFASYIKFRILLLTVSFIIFFSVTPSLYKDQEMLYMMYSLLIPIVMGLMLQSIGISYFQLIEKMQFIASIKIVTSIILIVTAAVSIGLHVNIHMAVFLYGFSYLAGGTYSIYLLCKHAAVDWKSPFQKQILSKLFPFFIGGLLIMLTPQLGPLVLEKTISLQLIGLFAVACRIPTALYQIPGVIAGAFFPLLFKHHNHGNFKEHTKLNILQIKVMSLIGICMTVSLFYTAEILITFLFGEGWTDVIPLLKILSFIVVVQSFNIAMADGLTTKELQSRRTIVQLLTIICGTILFYFMSIGYGITGAAWVVLGMEVIAFIGYLASNPIRKIILLQVLLPYGMYFSFSFIVNYNFLQTFPFAAAVTTISMIALMIFIMDQKIRNSVKELFRSRKRNIKHT